MASVPRIFECWQAPDRDAVHTLGGLLDQKLSALTRMEGADGHSERAVLERTGLRLQRPRRWHKIFERMGLMYRHDGVTHLTGLGRMLRAAEAHEEATTIAAISKAALTVLKRYQLKNPADETPAEAYPEGSDLHPYWAMWKAAAVLDWRLHWDEVNRELMRVLRADDIDAAIDRIRTARTFDGYDPVAGGTPAFPLQDRCYDEAPDDRSADGQVRDHFFTPWFRRAGFGEVFFQAGDDGYFIVPEDVRPLILEQLAVAPEFVAFEHAPEWLEFYGGLPDAPAPRLLADWDADVPDFGRLQGVESTFEIAAAALRSGKHLVLFGPPGTGKSELAVLLCKAHGIEAYMSTATADWTTFDTIGGYLPDPRLAREGGGTEPLNFFPGAILRSVERGNWIVIDELNRADIDKAFGELFTVLSGHPVRLPYLARTEGRLRQVVLGPSNDPNDDSRVISPDWRIIGTMNTFDKASLFQLSFAFMRRFAFVPLGLPSEATYQAIIRAEVERLRFPAHLDEFDEELITFATEVFASEENGLAAADLRVGPAIVLDVLRYAQARTTEATRLSEFAKTVFIESLPLYLLPQYEGRHREHPAIVEALRTTLQLSDAQADSLDSNLLPWTGYDASRE